MVLGLLAIYLLIANPDGLFLAQYPPTTDGGGPCTAVGNISRSQAEKLNADLQMVQMAIRTVAEQMEYILSQGGMQPRARRI